MIFGFLDLELDDRTRELRRSGRVVRMEPRVFDLLVHLVRNRDRVVSRGELLESVWEDVAVSTSSVSTAMSTLRRVLGGPVESVRGSQGAKGPIQTVHGRGFRFVAPVVAKAPELGESAEDPSLPSVAARGDDQPIFVGRESVLALLDSALADACASRERVVLLVGEAGIGKSHTLDAFERRARAAGPRVVVTRCLEGDATPAFWPWVRVLRELYEPIGDEPFERHAAALAPLLPELGEGVRAGDSEPDRFRVFDAISEIHRAAAREAPLVVVVDDFQWGDASSLGVFGYLARELRGSPVLLVAALRDPTPDPSESLRSTLAELSREPHVERVELEGLSPTEIERYLEMATGRPAPGQLAKRLHDRTDGNAFFLRELVRWLDGKDALDPERGAPAAAQVPPGVQEVIERRLEGASAGCHECLRLASALGREFDVRVLAAASRAPRDALLEALDEATVALVVEEMRERPGGYRFTHALVRDAVYASLAPGERALLHERLALAIEHLFGDQPGPHLAEISHHFEAALARGHDATAIEYAARAARHADARTAHFEAARLFERALRIAEAAAPDSGQVLQLLLELGDAHLSAGDTQATQRVFGRAADLARELHEPKALVRAALGYGATAIWGGRPDPGEDALLTEALGLLGDGSPATRAQLMSRLAAQRGFGDSFAAQREPARAALDLARETDDLEALVEALRARHLVLRGPDHLAERESLAREILEVAQRLGSRDHTFAVRELQACERLTRGDRAGFLDALEDAERVAAASHHPSFLWLSGVARASTLLLEGDLEEAERRIHVAAEHGRRARSPQAAPAALAQMFALRRVQGRLAELRPAFEGAVSGLDWIGSYPATLRAVLYAELGEEAPAREAFDAVTERGFERLDSGADWLICIAELAGVSAAIGAVDAAPAIERLLAPYEDLHAVYSGPLLYAGPVPHFLGRLAEVQGRARDARERFQQARRMAADVGANVTEARARAALDALS